MKTRLTAAGAALLALLAAVLAFGQPAQAAAGFTVANGKLYDANGAEFVMRGVNHAHTWYPQQTSSFADVKALGANSVRVVLASGQRWTRNTNADVANVISLCKANRLICVLEVHDTTGYGEQSGAASLDQAVDYWISLADVLTGEEEYLIVNIGNEPYGNQGYAAWTTDTSNAIKRLRAAGFDHTIMVDAPNWGQDWAFTMRDNATSVFAADPDRNTVFSVHMYGVFDTAAEISDYLGRFRSAGLPIVVGEFGHNHSDGDPDEESIFSYTQANGIGWLGWSWSGNGGGVEYLDMATNFNPASLTGWGQRIFNGANGIRQTAREATVFGTPPTTPPPTTPPPTTPPPTTPPPTTPPPTTPPPTTPPPTTPPPTTPPPTTPPPTTPPPTTPPPGGCTASYTVVNQWPGGFQGEVKVTAGSAAITGWTATWTLANGQAVNQSWNTRLTSSGSAVTARHVDWNGRLGAGASTSFGFIASWNGANAVPAVSCAAS
ncbi:mannan endo-1,4-beta-mannosidase [Micromonospora echinaurantiaca]|uniref:Endoglucanase n=1 Tax=Micromonospora echinaurantiaca TaxID=47857 RepID=A0A1C5J5M9_9ACTN|nr:cellulase family glycosylhydrolase [Micromonospora echinaurantiaca]SCG65882.1 mannan endo-1,4-beta-mannosidase [Micromonospora echinaurantiaca]